MPSARVLSSWDALLPKVLAFCSPSECLIASRISASFRAGVKSLAQSHSQSSDEYFLDSLGVTFSSSKSWSAHDCELAPPMVTTVRLPPLQTMNQMLAFAPHLKTKLPKHQANESSRGAPRSSNRLLWDTFRLRQQFFVGLVGRSLSVSDLRQPFPLCTTTRVVLSELSNRNSICQV